MAQKQGFTSPFDRHVLSILSSFDKLRMTGYAEGLRVTKKQFINRHYLGAVCYITCRGNERKEIFKENIECGKIANKKE